MNIVCDGPGPHDPVNGVLGTSDRPITGMRCKAPACAVPTDPAIVNGETLRQQAVATMVSNRAFGAAAKPGTAAGQASAAYDQAKVLSRQYNGIIRMLLGQLDATD